MPKAMTRKQTPPPNRARIEGTVRRDIEIRQDAINEDTREIELSFSSETPVERGFFMPWLEILGHDADEVDLSRLRNDAPFLADHRNSVREQIGVVTKAEIRDRRGVATVRISDDPDTEPLWRKIVNGTVRKISVGYQVREMVLVRMDEDGPDEFRVTDWAPWEISLVAIPADDSVGIGRSDGGRDPQYRIISLDEEESSMPRKRTGVQPSDARPEDNGVKGRNEDGGEPEPGREESRREPDRQEPDTAERDRLVAEGREQERKRVSAIEELFAPFERKYGDDLVKVRRECTANAECTVETARERLLKKIGEGIEPAGGDPEIRVGTTAEEKFREGAALALSQRGLFNHAQTEQSRERFRPDRTNEFLSMRLERLAEYALEQRGIRTLGL
ncbi:MAG: HK97 family phage prohead protease, partial [Alphaproteobacteria bacterium]